MKERSQRNRKQEHRDWESVRFSMRMWVCVWKHWVKKGQGEKGTRWDRQDRRTDSQKGREKWERKGWRGMRLKGDATCDISLFYEELNSRLCEALDTVFAISPRNRPLRPRTPVRCKPRAPTNTFTGHYRTSTPGKQWPASKIKRTTKAK